MGKQTIVILDVQGTLIDVNPIRHYVTGEKRNFTAFHTATFMCEPIQQTVWLADGAVMAGHKLAVFTGMTADYERPLRRYLSSLNLWAEILKMRPVGDFCKDVTLKERFLDEVLLDHEVIHAVDDNPDIVGLWERRGIPTTVIPGFHG